ncbi:hypothetical protein [Rhodocaloribacter sp.]
MTSIDYRDLEDAVEFVSAGLMFDAHAYISRETRKVYLDCEDVCGEVEIPGDVGDPGVYVEAPTKQGLNLGKRLVLRFVARALPDEYDEVENLFRRKGAYARFKDLLLQKGALDAWYEYERSATRAALVAWAEVEGFQVINLPDERAK